MILSPSRLKSFPNSDEIVSDLDIREKISPEGVGYDLRVARIENLVGSGSLLIETRHTGKTKTIGDITVSGNEILKLKGGGIYLASTIEKFKLPENMAAVFHPRSTLFRSGVIFQSGVAPYGYEGPMTFLIYVANPAGFEIQLGARFAHVVIHRVSGHSSAYRGQWQGGRITTTKSERQI